jgi:hypothetical protein
MPVQTSVEIYGVSDTLKELRGLDEALYWESVSKIKAAAEPMRSAIASSIPKEAPMSHWHRKGRLGWRPATTKVATQYGKKYNPDKRQSSLVRVVLSGASASLYDMAATSRSGAIGDAFIANLNKRGKASRAAWPTANRMVPRIHAAVVAATREVMNIMNKNLATRPIGK